jgi:hypothetical protein
MTKLYTTWWDNGFSYDDHERVLVGIFTTQRRAYTAGENYKSVRTTRLSSVYGGSFFDIFEITVNKPDSEVKVREEDHTEFIRQKSAGRWQ